MRQIETETERLRQRETDRERHRDIERQRETERERDELLEPPLPAGRVNPRAPSREIETHRQRHEQTE